MSDQNLKNIKEVEFDDETRRNRQLEKRRKNEESERRKKIIKRESTKINIIREINVFEARTKIPILKLSDPEIVFKDIEFSKEIPNIRKEEHEIKVPILYIFSPTLEEKEIKLNKFIPNVEIIKYENLIIPLIKLNKINVKCTITNFQTDIPKIKPRLETRLKVPIYKVSKTPMIKVISLFDVKIDKKLLQMLEVNKFNIVNQYSSSFLKYKIPEASEGEKIEEEPQDIISFVFSGYSTRITSKGPIVILYKELENDSTIGSFETICKRVFRERKEEEEPGYFPIKKLDDFNIREIEKYLKPEGNIIRIDLDLLNKDAKNKEENIYNILSEESLKETISRFIIGEISFLIFKTRDSNLYDYYKNVLERISENIEHPLKFMIITPQDITLDQKKIFTELAWGLHIKDVNIEIKNISGDRPKGTTLDDIFNKYGKIKHEEYLKNLETERGGIYALVTNKNKGEESDLHLQIKWFIVKLLSQKHKFKTLLEIENYIKTEEPLPESNVKGTLPIPDIWDIKENIVYEVETLFSQDREGSTPQKKIYDSIKKYEGTSINKINIILDNLTFLFHLKEIWGIKKNIKEWEEKTNKKVEFLTLDLENHKLIPLKNFSKKAKYILLKRVNFSKI